MAKKKGSNKSNTNSVETPQRASSDDVANPVSTSEQGKSVEDMGIEELRAELLAARAEITSLKVQSDASGKLHKPQEVQELHVKLQQLRKEQQEADAARDKAWKQLKVCHALPDRNVPQVAGMYSFLLVLASHKWGVQLCCQLCCRQHWAASQSSARAS